MSRGIGGISRYPVADFDPALPGSVKLMMVGDSQTAGDGGAGDTATAYREPFWTALRGMRSRLQLIGNASNIYRFHVDSTLGDGRFAATGGQTIAQASAQAAASEALYGPADVYTVLAGTNDVSSGSTASQVVAALVSLVQARLVANPAALVFVLTLCPWVSPAAGFAAHETTRLAVNAALPAALAALGEQVFLVQAGSLLTAAHMGVSGNHPNGLGYRLIGRAAANAVFAQIGPAGPTLPRTVMRRQAVSALAITGNTQVAAIASNTGTNPAGHESFSVGLYFNPTNLSNTSIQRIVGSIDGSLQGMWLIDLLGAGGTPGLVELTVGNYGSGATAGTLTTIPSGSGSSTVVRLNTWHALLFAADASTNLVQLWIMRAGSDGKAQSFLAASKFLPAWNLTSTNPVLVGSADGTLNGAPGLYSRLWVARGYVATPDDVEAFYYDQAIPPAATAYYSLEDGSGTAFAPALGETSLPNGALSGGAGWSAAGAVPTPWDL